MTTPAASSADSGGTFLGHPTGLFVLFFAEMWERFSYYGMRALLVLYLTKHFLFERDAAYGLYGAYTTLVYITPVIGGVLADRYLGQRKAVLFGAIMLVLGHAGMALEGQAVAAGGTPDPGVLNIFYFSLALIITGVGFLKANISTIVGELYPKTDVRRDSAFTIFYVGINLGAFLGALVAGYLGETYGWAYGFGAAGIGMLAGLIVFVLGKPALRGAGEPRNPALLKEPLFAGISREIAIYIGALLMTVIVWWLVRDQDTVNTLLIVAGIVVVGYILYRSVFTLEPHARNRILIALVLISTQILFWGLFEQAGSSLNIFTDESVDRHLFGWEVPASMFQSVNAFYIVLLGPVFAGLWVWLGKKGLEPSAPMKFALALVQLGLGFLVLVFGANSVGLTPVIFIFLIYLLHTTGELCLSPVGLSAMTRLSVKSMAGLMMGTWFLASGAGNAVAAIIAQATAAPSTDGENVVLAVYKNVGWIAVAVGVGMAALSPFLAKLMHLDTLNDNPEEQVADAFGDGQKPAT
ncbi:MAG: peptide MFS transporter [Hyphomonas sp.]|uniref:peptide MFS transporter n=1 Tax=Hyphomonas sp. TaxID=87 RepID=UPI00182779AF|nr:peptide MFS transporter [Hyphomonas sp.]MBA3070428.1 peptide MFS transporter [Hyphomonas sp.]MBU4061742.1 peptide MFS transporter [Alphaproteobacteria bacterium]MBU4164550.1 peptide MFS transporter [Alphaproteobacteria bacterium]